MTDSPFMTDTTDYDEALEALARIRAAWPDNGDDCLWRLAPFVEKHAQDETLFPALRRTLLCRAEGCLIHFVEDGNSAHLESASAFLCLLKRLVDLQNRNPVTALSGGKDRQEPERQPGLAQPRTLRQEAEPPAPAAAASRFAPAGGSWIAANPDAQGVLSGIRPHRPCHE